MPICTQRKWLPGDPSPDERIIQDIRVNHAGEYGAVRIYQGQLSVFKGTDKEPILQHMLEQEEEHLAAFSELISERRVRPTVLTPLWNVLGYGLGKATALMGERAAMACTVAVEEVIDEHYQEQLDRLESNPAENSLRDKIKRFREEELEHRDQALEYTDHNPGHKVLRTAIQKGSRLAIWLSKRI